MKIDDAGKSFIRLLLRSPDKGDGWRSVSPTLAKLAETRAESHPELFERRFDETTMFIRLSERGQILADYL